MQAKVIRFEAKGQAVLADFELRAPGPGEVLIENDFSAVSAGTERANLVGLPNTSTASGFPFIPGYSAVGRIIEVGDGVEGLQLGDLVVNNWTGHRSHALKKAAGLVKVIPGVEPLEASFAVIASFPFLGVRKLRIEIGESVMVAGLGILGVFAAQIACLSGGQPVLAADFDPKRRELASRLGVDLALSPDDPDFKQKILDITDGKGVNAVVEVTGAAAALQQALEYIAFGGRVSLLGCTRVSDAQIDYYKYVHRRGITIVGSHTHTRPVVESAPGQWTEQDDYRVFMKLVAAKKLQVLPVISEVVSPVEAPAVYARLAEDSQPPLGIAFDWRALR